MTMSTLGATVTLCAEIRRDAQVIHTMSMRNRAGTSKRERPHSGPVGIQSMPHLRSRCPHRKSSPDCHALSAPGSHRQHCLQQRGVPALPYGPGSPLTVTRADAPPGVERNHSAQVRTDPTSNLPAWPCQGSPVAGRNALERFHAPTPGHLGSRPHRPGLRCGQSKSIVTSTIVTCKTLSWPFLA